MTKIERYESQIAELEERKRRLIAGRDFVRSISLQKKIDEIKAMVKELKEYVEPRPLSESVTPKELKEMNIVPLMLTCHLIADLLTEVCYEVVDICRKHGFEKVNFVPELKDIIRKTDRFSSFLLQMNPAIKDLLLRNETFNASMIKKYLNHIEQRIKHFEKNQQKERQDGI